MAGSRAAQASTEFIFILAISMVVITIIMVLAQQQITTVQKQKDSADAQNAVLDLSAAAKEVYAQGEGSRKQVFIRLPGSYEPGGSSIGARSIQIRAAGTDYVAVENFNLRGYLPATSGGHWVWVTSEGSRVRIGLAMMELDRNRIYLVMNRNTTATAPFSVTNAWIRSINVTTAVRWDATDVTMDGVPSGFQLNVDSSNMITAHFTAGADAGGIYMGEIELNASDGQGATESAEVPVTVYVVGYTAPEKDLLGPVITAIYQDPAPAIVYEPLAIILTATDEQAGNNSIRDCEMDADQAGNWQVILPVDGAYDQPTETAMHNYTAGFSWGVHSIRARCTDVMNNTGPTAFYYFNVTQSDMLGPIVTNLTHTEYPTTLSNITASAIATDVYTGGSNIASCQVKVDTGAWHNATPMDGLYDSPSENVSYNAGQLAPGYHTIYWQCVDVLGNAGGTYNDSFGVVDVDLMLVLDQSYSMDAFVTSSSSSTVVETTNTGFTRLKNITIPAKNGNLANLSTEIKADVSGCTAYYEARINGVVVASGNRTSTSYGTIAASINVSQFTAPFDVALYMKRSPTANCKVSNQLLSLQQAPKKITASQDAAKTFLNAIDSSNQAGLVTFSASATLSKQLAAMTEANKTALKAAIDVVSYGFSTCLECGLKTGADELTSARGRPAATRVIVMLTDGMSNSGDPVAGAVYCRDRDVTVYTIGFGNDVNDTELTNIALLTHGEYYFAPNAETLMDIFMNIGK
ncbi:MAG: VWA domain-containing protein [Candidatus ainarchaeum sp.]|nr:VWA domain-containing protein [Candidatus ainarchaeum sp.]